MNATLSTRQIRLVALLVLIVVAAGGFLVATKHKSTTSATRTTASSTPARTTHATTTPTPSKTHTHTATPAKLQTHGLPVTVARADSCRENSWLSSRMRRAWVAFFSTSSVRSSMPRASCLYWPRSSSP